MFYWIALLVASCLAGCRSHSGETDMQTRMRTGIVTNVRGQRVAVLDGLCNWLPDGGFMELYCGMVLR